MRSGAEAGLPPGVLNAVTGEGAVVGEAMGLSMEVDVLVFTGSGRTGRRLMEYAARSNMKRVYLELGGKSPISYLPMRLIWTMAAKPSPRGGVFPAIRVRSAWRVCAPVGRGLDPR